MITFADQYHWETDFLKYINWFLLSRWTYWTAGEAKQIAHYDSFNEMLWNRQQRFHLSCPSRRHQKGKHSHLRNTAPPRPTPSSKAEGAQSPSIWNFPDAQILQFPGTNAPVAEVHRLVGHGTGIVELIGQKKPGGHSSAERNPPLQKLPAGHDWHLQIRGRTHFRFTLHKGESAMCFSKWRSEVSCLNQAGTQGAWRHVQTMKSTSRQRQSKISHAQISHQRIDFSITRQAWKLKILIVAKKLSIL